MRLSHTLCASCLKFSDYISFTSFMSFSAKYFCCMQRVLCIDYHPYPSYSICTVHTAHNRFDINFADTAIRRSEFNQVPFGEMFFTNDCCSEVKSHGDRGQRKVQSAPFSVLSLYGPFQLKNNSNHEKSTKYFLRLRKCQKWVDHIRYFYFRIETSNQSRPAIF